MRGRTATFGACLLTVLAALSAPLASGAESPARIRDRAESLRRENAVLESHTRAAVLDLYALESRLARIRTRLATLRERAAELERSREQVRRQLSVARHVMTISTNRLAERLRTVYEQGDVDPVAVILGARSLDDAIDSLDALSRTAEQNRDVIAQTLAARRELRAAARALAARQAEVAHAAAAAARTAIQLTAGRSERAAHLTSLARERRLNARQIAALEQAAAAAEARAAAATAAEPPSPARGTVPGSGSSTSRAGGSITVLATGYSLAGRTSIGVQAGWGVVAVDPAVIPLGSHMSIPGYGEGVAADTGSAVRGAAVDLWFPTSAQARAWGRRLVTITLH